MILVVINKTRIRSNLIDNGLDINVSIINLLDKLGVDRNLIKPTNIVIHFLDNVGRKPLGKITLPIKVGLVTLPTLIHVMLKPLWYNILLGRLWIHAMMRVSSNLHCEMKYENNNKIHTVKVDKKVIIYKLKLNIMLPTLLVLWSHILKLSYHLPMIMILWIYSWMMFRVKYILHPLSLGSIKSHHQSLLS